MKYFRRAIGDSLHHWPAIVLATLCSICVAALWSANIGAMYPVIEMTLDSKSVQTSLSEKLVETGKDIQTQEIQVNDLKTQLQAAQDEASKAKLRAEVKWHESRLSKTRQSESWQQWRLQMAEKYLPRDPFRTICVIMGVVVVSTLIKHLLMLTNDLLIGRVSTTIVRTLRMRIFDKALAFDRRTYQCYGTSTLLASITHSCEALTNGLINFFGAAIREPLRVISCLILAALVCWRLLLLSAVLAPLMIVIVYWFNGRIKNIARAILGRTTGFHEVILEALGNIFTVQAYTMEADERKRFASCTKDMQSCTMRMIFYSSASKPFTELVGVGMIAVTVCVGAYLIVNKQTHIGFLKICDEPMTSGSLMVFFGALIGASDPMRKMSGVFTTIYSGSIAATTLYQMLDTRQFWRNGKTPRLWHILTLK